MLSDLDHGNSSEPESEVSQQLLIVQQHLRDKAGADEIPQFCTDEIAHFNIPNNISFADESLMTITGKPQKFKLRAALQEQPGAS